MVFEPAIIICIRYPQRIHLRIDNMEDHSAHDRSDLFMMGSHGNWGSRSYSGLGRTVLLAVNIRWMMGGSIKSRENEEEIGQPAKPSVAGSSAF